MKLEYKERFALERERSRLEYLQKHAHITQEEAARLVDLKRKIAEDDWERQSSADDDDKLLRSAMRGYLR